MSQKQIQHLSEKQRQIVDFIESYIAKHHFSPSMREIGNAVNLSSTSAVYFHLGRLKDLNIITYEASTPRSVRLVKETSKHEPKTIVIPVIEEEQLILNDQEIDLSNADTYMELEAADLPKEGVHPAFAIILKQEDCSELHILPNDCLIFSKDTAMTTGKILLVYDPMQRKVSLTLCKPSDLSCCILGTLLSLRRDYFHH